MRVTSQPFFFISRPMNQSFPRAVVNFVRTAVFLFIGTGHLEHGNARVLCLGSAGVPPRNVA